MGEMRDSDWSRPKILRSDWLGLIGAIMTTGVPVAREHKAPLRFLVVDEPITEKMIISRFLSPFLTQFHPIPKKIILVINHVQVVVLLIIRNGLRKVLRHCLLFKRD